MHRRVRVLNAQPPRSATTSAGQNLAEPRQHRSVLLPYRRAAKMSNGARWAPFQAVPWPARPHPPAVFLRATLTRTSLRARDTSTRCARPVARRAESRLPASRSPATTVPPRAPGASPQYSLKVAHLAFGCSLRAAGFRIIPGTHISIRRKRYPSNRGRSFISLVPPAPPERMPALQLRPGRGFPCRVLQRRRPLRPLFQVYANHCSKCTPTTVPSVRQPHTQVTCHCLVLSLLCIGSSIWLVFWAIIHPARSHRYRPSRTTRSARHRGTAVPAKAFMPAEEESSPLQGLSPGR